MTEVDFRMSFWDSKELGHLFCTYSLDTRMRLTLCHSLLTASILRLVRGTVPFDCGTHPREQSFRPRSNSTLLTDLSRFHLTGHAWLVCETPVYAYGTRGRERKSLDRYL